MNPRKRTKHKPPKKPDDVKSISFEVSESKLTFQISDSGKAEVIATLNPSSPAKYAALISPIEIWGANQLCSFFTPEGKNVPRYYVTVTRIPTKETNEAKKV